MGVEMGNTIVKELDNRPVEAVVSSQADVMQHKPLVVELEDNVNSSRTPEIMINGNHIDQIEKQPELVPDGAEKTIINSTTKVTWETLETSSSKEGSKANSSNGEEKVVQMDEKSDDAVTSPTENISLKSELPETIGDSPGDEMTITKQTDCTEQNEPNSLSSTEICAPSALLFSDTKDENGHAMDVTEKDYHNEERHELKAFSLKRVSSAKSMIGSIANNVEDTDKAFKLASTELVPGRLLDSNPSGELFYLEAVDMDIKRASLDTDGIQFISKLFRQPDLVDWGSVSDSEEKQNELIDKEEEVIASQVPNTLHEDWEEEPNMIEILASSSLSLTWYSNQELGEEDKYASHSTDLQDGYDDSSLSVQEVASNGCNMDSGKEDINTDNADKSSLFDHQIKSPETEMEEQTLSPSPYSPRIIQNPNNIAMDALESDSEYSSTNVDVFLLPTLDQEQMQTDLPECPSQGFQQPLEILNHHESQQDQSNVRISDEKVPSQGSDNGFPNSHISIIDDEASILEITDSGWERPPYESNMKKHSAADDIAVEQIQKAHVGVLEDDPKFLSSEDLSLNLHQGQSKCQITDDTDSTDALPQLKIIEQKNQAADDSDLASQASAIERNDRASIQSTLKELIVDEVAVVQDQETGAVSMREALTNIGASKSENHPEKLQQPYETKESEVAVSEHANGTDNNHATDQSIGVNGKATSENDPKEQSGATMSNQTPQKVVAKEAQDGGVFNIPVKKTTPAISVQVREKQKSRSSFFSSCMCCTTVI